MFAKDFIGRAVLVLCVVGSTPSPMFADQCSSLAIPAEDYEKVNFEHIREGHCIEPAESDSNKKREERAEKKCKETNKSVFLIFCDDPTLSAFLRTLVNYPECEAFQGNDGQYELIASAKTDIGFAPSEGGSCVKTMRVKIIYNPSDPHQTGFHFPNAFPIKPK